uniref:Replication factor A C-terminal domain-containing protein n=1 Tax=Brassica oleracea TaxID=3712 RepID=A0A3P6E9L4_BRAOL|nr:unnamed protein product [Brassica oleracea]
MAMKRNGKSSVSSDTDEKCMFFKDVSLGPHETQLRFRLIHFWEARNPVKKTITGLEMLLIDEQGTVIQGFIPPGRIKKYLPDMKDGSVYRLNNFYGSKNKPMYRVADHIATVSFTWNSELSVLHEIPTSFDQDSFRFHSYEDFEANCDLKGDLYDVVGHMKLVNGHTLIERPTPDEVKIDTTRHIMVHVQSHDGPVMKLYLWDQAAADFCKKFNSYDNTPTVLLVTAVNTKRLGGTLALTSMSPSRVFMDYDVQPTIDYFNWLGSNPKIAKQVSADVVTKRETLTIADIFSYMKQESAKLGTILDAVDAMLRLPKAQHLWYRAKISVYDNSDQAVFVLLGDDGRVLTGRHASELVSRYFEANGSEGADHLVPVPEALISTIGQTHKFCVKVTQHNFSGDTRAITVTKILSLHTHHHPRSLSLEATLLPRPGRQSD